MKKLFLILLLAFVIFAGCSYKNEPAKKEEKPEKSQVPSETTAKSEEKEKPANLKIAVYFPDNEAMYLDRFEYEISENEDKAKAVLERLFKGPAPEKHILPAPSEMNIPQVSISSDTAVVDFDENSKAFYPKGSTAENMFIYSIVNSLTETLGVKKVKFTFGGKTVSVDGSNYDFATQDFEFDKDIVRK